MRRVLSSLLVAAAAVGTFVPTSAQVRPIYDMGAAGLTQLLGRLQTTASAMHTGAHPDDEDSAFMARTARGDHARTAYLALNRGEGGQNIIGTELFDALGVIRTEELLQARRLDGGEQFFTRTFDYGFSKSLEEASAKWDDRQVLGDMVRIIRMFRPLVIYSRFSGTPTDGHGHHQMAGFLTPQAFKAAADPTQFPEQIQEGLRPWQAKKLYRGVGFGGGNQPMATVQVQSGVVDPVVGRSFAEISFEGRSQHKSQEMGTIETRGPIASPLILLDSKVPSGRPEQSIFEGLDTTIPGLARLAGLPEGSLRTELATLDAAVKRAVDEYQPLEPAKLVPTLINGYRAVRSAREALKTVAADENARAEADFLLAFKENDFTEAIVRAAGVVIDPLSDEETVVQGGRFTVTVRSFMPDGSAVRVTDAKLRTPAGWTVEAAAPPPPQQGRGGGGGPFGRQEVATAQTRLTVTVPADAPLTQPYFVEEARRGDQYNWTSQVRGLPFAPPLVNADVTLDVGRGTTLTVTRPVVYRFADRVRGELRREINVVPSVTIGVDTKFLIVPTGTTANQQRLVVRAASFSPQAVSGTLRLRLPQGWTSQPASIPFTLGARGDRTAATFTITAPTQRRAGALEIVAEAQVGDRVYAKDVQEIAYPHIQTHRIYTTSSTTAQVVDLKVAPVKVGYIMGTGDQVPDALRRLGVEVTLIDDEGLTTGDLSRFDTIMVGVRASEGRPAFVANGARLKQYMEAGGTLIVQYQQTDFAQRDLAPYPMTQPTNSRVTEELAPVSILVPTHPVFTFPNQITSADFNNWVQERNLYAWVTWDPRYTPLLETQDRGEMPQRGAQLYADVGRGRFVYTAYSWFRQLNAGVPGAYRQIANLISLAKAPR